MTGSVSSVSAKQIAAIPVSSASEALQGKMAGVSITTTEGSPDADVKIRVRGGGSLSQDNSPLYIVDGFPVSSISDIAPTDIQSVDVLKDASSTAIYGARGANGVIIITTKSGQEGKVQVNFGASYGLRKVTKMVDVLNPYEFVMWQQELDQKVLIMAPLTIWRFINHTQTPTIKEKYLVAPVINNNTILVSVVETKIPNSISVIHVTTKKYHVELRFCQRQHQC